MGLDILLGWTFGRLADSLLQYINRNNFQINLDQWQESVSKSGLDVDLSSMSLELHESSEEIKKFEQMISRHQLPKEEQIKSFKDSKKYGVWIDKKRVNNEILNNYKNTDFSQLFVSRLAKNAKNYGKHYYQVDLMTNEYYDNYKNEITAREGKMLVPIDMYKKTRNE